MPDEPLIAHGPYRFLRHPNYWVVAAEMVVLPMVFGLLWYALLFGILNGAITYWRMNTEDDALRPAEH